MTYRVTSRLYYGAPCNANDIMRIMRRMRIEDLCPDADPFCFHFSFLFSCSLFCFHHEEGENLCSDAEDKGSLEQVYEGIPATPDFISPNFPRTYHQKDFNLCSVSFDKIYFKNPFWASIVVKVCNIHFSPQSLPSLAGGQSAKLYTQQAGQKWLISF